MTPLMRRRAMMRQQKDELPGGYTRLEYVQWKNKMIETNIAANGSQWVLELMRDANPRLIEIIIAASTRYGHHATANTTGKWGLGEGVETSIPVTTRSVIGINFSVKSITMSINSQNISRAGAEDLSTEKAHLFGFGLRYYYVGKIYSVKCVSGGSFNGVPAQRESDLKVGIYDTVSDIFYPTK